ncbi:hypothetical protein ABZY44_23805 [Streptomyces sp. NPDC006544]
MSETTSQEQMEALRKAMEAQEASERALSETLHRLSQQPENQ